jgi:hypothetical protein
MTMIPISILQYLIPRITKDELKKGILKNTFRIKNRDVRFRPRLDFDDEISEPITYDNHPSLYENQPFDQIFQNYEFWNQKFVSPKLFEYSQDNLPYCCFHNTIRFVKKFDVSEFEQQYDIRPKAHWRNGFTYSEEAISDARDLICLKYTLGIYNYFIEAIYFPKDVPKYIILINHRGETERVKIQTRQNRYLFMGMYPNNNLTNWSSLDIQFEHPTDFYLILHEINYLRNSVYDPYFVIWNDHCWDSQNGICVLKKVSPEFRLL